ncbi:MAG: CbiX/SirB N-terminal domain-containing protein [candidate division NC10 bacterium]|nr:CbiX/SirB N-terminal domain-containing protein [candidate division NC10 bacterium]
MRKEEGAILLAHGSRSRHVEEGLEEIASQVREGLGGGRVILAFLQFNRPNLSEAIDQAVAEGLARLIVVPFFLASGIHVRKDIPEELEQARLRHPGVEILLSRPLLPDRRIAAILLDRIREASSPEGV